MPALLRCPVRSWLLSLFSVQTKQWTDRLLNRKQGQCVRQQAGKWTKASIFWQTIIFWHGTCFHWGKIREIDWSGLVPFSSVFIFLELLTLQSSVILISIHAELSIAGFSYSNRVINWTFVFRIYSLKTKENAMWKKAKPLADNICHSVSCKQENFQNLDSIIYKPIFAIQFGFVENFSISLLEK